MQRNIRLFVAILLVAVVAGWISLSGPMKLPFIDREVKSFLGLDLQGGMQVMLEADVADPSQVTSDSMAAAKAIIENRVNGLGVSEPLIQQQGTNRIVVELPGIKDPEMAIRTFGQTGLLEFIDAGSLYLEPGTVVTTTESVASSQATSVTSPTATVGVTATAAATGTRAASQPTATAASTVTPPAGVTSTATVTATTSTTGTTPITGTAPVTSTATPQGPTFRTIMTGKHLKSAEVGFDQLNRPVVNFKLTDEGTKLMGDYSSANVGRYMAIVMDKKVISCPVIKTAITGGDGEISGSFTVEEVRSLVIQLKYGALPIPLKVVENRTVGPTLGQDSVNRSLTAGIIGLGIVVLFMLIYYRLPGLIASVALLIYTMVVFAIFKLVPVTLTVPGIAGFILSIGMAVDANILIFERTREELRSGKTLGAALEAGFSRAWTSIRDSNVSTLITCVILFWFGMNFGASIIKGFALTLGIGVIISLFTAITVTRNFLRLIVPTELAKNKWLFSIVDDKENS